MARPLFSRDPDVDRSLRHAVRDGAAYSVMTGAGESYFSAFAIHFKATAADVGILATLPPLVGSFFQYLSVALGKQTRSRRGVIMAGAILQVLSWLPLTFLPLLFPHHALILILGSLVLFYGAGNLVTPQWISLMGDLVPERQRGRYFARRSRYASITGLSALVVAGLVLQLFSDSTAAIAGFFIIFSLAAAARLVSAYHMSCMYDPPLREATPAWRPRRWRGTPALHFTRFFALMQFSVAIAGPFFAVYMLRELEFTYFEFMVNTAVAVLVQFLTLRMWGRLGDAFGHRLVLIATGFAIAAVPALWLFSTDFWYLLGAQALSGLVWGGFTLSAGNVLYDLVPGRERVRYLASHNVTAGVGTFLGALIGGWLVSLWPERIVIGHYLLGPGSAIGWLFLLSAGARLATAAAFLPALPESRRVRPFTWRAALFRVTGARHWLRRPPRRLEPREAPAA